MAKLAVEHIFTGNTTDWQNYDSTKTVLGDMIQQRTGSTALDKFAGPMPIGMARPLETSPAFAVAFPHAIRWSSTLDHVFLADFTAAAATRRITMFTYDRSTSTFNWKGFITINFPFGGTQGTYTIRGMRALRYTYSTGTVGVSGTSVTGNSTAWQTARFASGARIGFGTTNPTAVTQWYEISSINNDTSITLTSDAGMISSGTAFVIEEYRILLTLTNGTTATNGGLFLVKGLSPDAFTASGLTIAAAVTTDNVRATMWLGDAATSTNTTATGVGIDPMIDNSTHYAYVMNGTTTCQIFKYNIRAALTLSAGKSNTDAFVLKTGVSATLTGTASQLNNGRMVIAAHGPGNGVNCFYFATTTRIYRATASNITSGSTTFLDDAMIEVPPGTTNTYAATSTMVSVDYSESTDLFFITTSATTPRLYATKYNTNSTPFDLGLLVDVRQQDQSTASAFITPIPSYNGVAFSMWTEGGICYLNRNSAATATAQLYALPIGAHWVNSGDLKHRLVTPSLATPNASALYRVYVSNSRQAGSGNFGFPTEPIKVYARTSGISNNSGNWIETNDTGDLSTLTVTSEIQIAIEFKTVGSMCLPSQIFNVCVTYEDNTTDSHYQPSVGNSSVTDRRFAWRFASAFGGTVPPLRIRLYDAVTGTLLLNDNSDTPTGTWEKSTNGGANWSSYNTLDKSNETTYIRYTPASLGDNITVRALLTLV